VVQEDEDEAADVGGDEAVTDGKNESILQMKLRKVVVLIGKVG